MIDSGRITDECIPFPTKRDCAQDPYFCDTWKSAAFLIMLAAVLEVLTLIAYLAVFNGGYVRRQNGWKVLCLLHLLIGTAS